MGLRIFPPIKAPGLLTDGDIPALQRRAREVPRDGRIVELGSLFGQSAIAMAQVTRAEIWCIDTWNGPVDGMPLPDLDDGHGFARFRLYTSEYPRIRWIVGDSAQSAVKFSDGSVDLIFIDADHSLASVLRDLRAWWPKVRAGGWILGHDAGEDTEVRAGVLAFRHELGFETTIAIEFLYGTGGMFELRRP